MSKNEKNGEEFLIKLFPKKLMLNQITKTGDLVNLKNRLRNTIAGRFPYSHGIDTGSININGGR